jgi:voltage-gated potassium channel Kch
MTGRIKPVRSESTWFRVAGIRTGKGVVLLYPDRLASVRIYAEYVCWFLMIVVLDIVAYHIFRDIAGWLAPFFGVLLGSLIGRPVDRWLAARMVAAGRGNAASLPLDLIASLRTERSAVLFGLSFIETVVVTMADGNEYGFAGRTGSLQADIASALAERGRDVRATPLGLAVTPRAVGNGA